MQGRRAVELLMTKDLGRPGVEKTAHVAALRLHKVWIRQHFKNHPLFPWWMLQWHVQFSYFDFGAWGSTFLCDGDLLPVNPLNPPGSRGRVCSFYRAIFFWVPQGQVRDFLAMLRAMMEQDDGARMVDNVGLEQLDGNHWGKRPESRDKNMSELSGVNVFWRFWTSPSSFSWRLHRLYIHNSWVMLKYDIDQALISKKWSLDLLPLSWWRDLVLVWDWVNTIDLPKEGVSRSDSSHVEMHEHVDFGRT